MSDFKLGEVGSLSESFKIPNLDNELYRLFSIEDRLYAIHEDIYNECPFQVGDTISFLLENPRIIVTECGSTLLLISAGCVSFKKYKPVKKKKVS